MTLIPYHGAHFRDPKEVYPSLAKDGTSHFHAYATAYVVLMGQRFTVALTAVAKGEPLKDVLQRLLKQTRSVGVKPRLLLLDRGFYSGDVIRYLQAARYPFLIPVVIRGRKADWFDPNLNLKVQSFASHYGLVILPTRPYTPRHKGKVERGIACVQDNGFRGRSFASLEEQNQFLRDWEQTVADTRLHGTARHQVGSYFQAVERPALQPLPQEPFPCFHEGRRIVHRDGHVEVQRAYYSAPPEYLARQVWVRWDTRVIRIFNDRFQQIAIHTRREPGHFSTQPVHIHAEKISGVEKGAAWLLTQLPQSGLDWTDFSVIFRRNSLCDGPSSHQTPM